VDALIRSCRGRQPADWLPVPVHACRILDLLAHVTMPDEISYVSVHIGPPIPVEAEQCFSYAPVACRRVRVCSMHEITPHVFGDNNTSVISKGVSILASCPCLVEHSVFCVRRES